MQTRGDDIETAFDPDQVLGEGDMKTLDSWKRFISLPLIVGTVFRMGSLALSEPETLGPKLKLASGMCRRAATESGQSDLWDPLAKLFELIESADSTAEDLIRLGKQTDTEDYKPIKIAAYLGATIKQRGEPAGAAQAQLSIFPYISQCLRTCPGIYRLGLDFLSRYWIDQLGKSSFLFRTPALARQAVVDAGCLPERGRAQAVLSAVAVALDVPLGPRAKEWLGSK
jgi:hypothetical protein